MKIKEIRTVLLDMPKRPPSSAARRPNANIHAERAFPISKYREFSRIHTTIPGAKPAPFWVQVIAEDGTWGMGQGTWGAPVAAIIETVYAPLLTGRDCFAIELLNDMMWRASQRQGDQGSMCTARSAVDLALWDLKGKLLGQPVYSLIGGPAREALDLYCTSDDLDWARELGFRRFKISNPVHYDDGEGGLRLAEERIARARDLVGTDCDLMYNPVMSFNVEFAIRIAERLRQYRLRWIEEPLMPWNLEGHVQIREAASFVPWATGEDHRGRHVFRQLLERRAVDVVQPDIRWCGGLTEALKIYHIAESFGISVIPHFGANDAYSQHFSLAMPEAPIAEYWMTSDPGVPLEETPRLPGVPVPVDGRLVPSDAPGFGFEIPEGWIRPFSVMSDGWPDQ